MAENPKKEERQRFVTNGVKERVDNFTQLFIWNQIIDNMKLRPDSMLEISLRRCEACMKQRVSVVSEDEETSKLGDCIIVPSLCDENIIIFYDKDLNHEYMMLLSEAHDLVEKKGE